MKKLTFLFIYIFSIYAVALLFFGLFRGVLFFNHLEQTVEIADRTSMVLQAFWMGFRFDTVISCYVLIAPVVVGMLFSLFQFYPKALFKGIFIYCSVVFSVTLLVCAANIPYFNVFFKNINASIWNWIDEPTFVVEMIVKESIFRIYFIVYLAVNAAFCFVLYKMYRCFWNKVNGVERRFDYRYGLYSFFIGIVFLGVCFIGGRGRIELKSPIRVGTAYFSNNAFLNQLGLNPNFVLLNTSLEQLNGKSKEVKLMDNSEAIRNVRQYLNITSEDADSPIVRMVSATDFAQRKNVVLILMESMSSYYLYGDSTETKVPFLKDLLMKSVHFPNFYSAGIHTFNGIYSSLFSYPALLSQHSMKSGDMLSYAGMPAVLRNHGYRTIYFSTHDAQFDNVGGFLMANQVEQIISQQDYPGKEVLSNLGVPDDYMFRFSMDYLNNAPEPFFATFLTASNHPPYIIPSYFSPKSEKIKEQIVEYSDWAIQQFFELAEKEKWYENTIFVITGDHGAIIEGGGRDAAFSFHRVPFIVYEPDKQEAKLIDHLGGQIDIFPTIMGVLGLEYRNNTLGVDILNEQRPYMFFSSDDSFECIDHEWYYVHRTDGDESLYRIDNNGVDVIDAYPEIAAEMKKYAASMLQATQYMIKEDLVR